MPKTQAKYLENKGCCPMCHSVQTSGLDVRIDVETSTRDVVCLMCGAEWTDVFILVGYRSLTDANGERVEYEKNPDIER